MRDPRSGLTVDVRDLARRGQAIYDIELRSVLEADHHGRFLAVEPDTKQYWLGETVEDVCRRARAVLPGRFFHIIRIGFPTAHIARCLQT